MVKSKIKESFLAFVSVALIGFAAVHCADDNDSGQSVSTRPSTNLMVNFAFEKDSANPFLVSFMDMSMEVDGSGTLTYLWDFGVSGIDTDTSTERNPSFTYTEEDSYIVRLTVSSSASSASSFVERIVRIGDDSESPANLRVNFAFEIDTANPFLVSFMDMSMETGGSGTLTYLWNFGVSGIDTDTSTEESPSFTYTEEGSYIVRLTVSSSASSASSFVERIVRIGDDSESPANLMVNFAFEIDTTNPFLVSFMDMSMEIGGTGTLTYLWDFGVSGIDTDTSTERNPSFTYTEEGSYIVRLTVSSSASSASSFVERIVRIGDDSESPANLRVNFAFEIDSANPFLVSFMNMSMETGGSGTLTYLWDFGVSGIDTDTSTEESPSFTYTEEGSYIVRLTVSSSASGASSFVERIVRIQDLSIALPSWDDNPCSAEATLVTPGDPYQAIIDRWVMQDRLTPRRSGQVVFVGSSSIAQWERLYEDFSSKDPIQRGFSGSRIWDTARYAEELIVRHDPRAVVIFAGTNDVTAGHTVEQTVDGYRCIVEKVANGVRNIPIAYIGITPIPQRYMTDRPKWEIALEANERIEALAEEWSGLHYIDTPSAFLQTGIPPTSDFFDGVHLNAAGYALWTAIIAPLVELIAPALPPPDPTLPPSTRLLVDLGPSNPADGARTVSADTFGQHWNSWHESEGQVLLVPGESLGGLVDTEGNSTGVRLVISRPIDSNGILNGGLLAPLPELLGNLAVNTATQDYFFVATATSPGAFSLTGLDPTASYTLRLFGTRNSSGTRITTYRLTGADGPRFVDLQTSGSGIGASSNGNDSNVAVFSQMRPDPWGALHLNFSVKQGGFAYLGLIELIVEPRATTADNVIITRWTYGYPASAGGAGDDQEFVELANPSGAPVDISDWTLRSGSSSDGCSGGTVRHTFGVSLSIRSQSYYLLTTADYEAHKGDAMKLGASETAPDGDDGTLTHGISHSNDIYLCSGGTEIDRSFGGLNNANGKAAERRFDAVLNNYIDTDGHTDWLVSPNASSYTIKNSGSSWP